MGIRRRWVPTAVLNTLHYTHHPAGINPERRAERTRELAAWVRETLLYLGPLFIKLGQYVHSAAA